MGLQIFYSGVLRFHADGVSKLTVKESGFCKSLKSIVHFYNTRDLKNECPDPPFTREKEALQMNCWPPPEVEENVNIEELGILGLTDSEEDAIVAFLTTLSDGYNVKNKNSRTVENRPVSTGRPFRLKPRM